MKKSTKYQYVPGTIRLFSGRYVNPLALTVDDIDLVDIAHGLAHRCRFTGHTKVFYSVAQHSLRVAELVPPVMCLSALLHDASEAYLFDIASPIKAQFPELVKLENDIMDVIARKFCVLGFDAPELKQADKIALQEEWDTYCVGNPPRYYTNHLTIRDLFINAVEYELIHAGKLLR